jgi:hypothetical protein
MKKVLWLLLLVTVVACGPTTTELVPPDTSAIVDTAVPATNETIETAETDAPADAATSPAAANLDDFVPASNITEASIIREQDWRKGATEPLVEIIEYGDFQ